MQNVNVQIRLPKDIDRKIEELAEGPKSAFIREAICEKIEKEKARRLEGQWIESLKKHPEDSSALKEWIASESWEP